MPRLKETLDELHAAVETSTSFQTDQNKYEVRCGVCNEMFYVDEATYGRVLGAIRFDPTNNPFRCQDCDGEYEEASAC